MSVAAQFTGTARADTLTDNGNGLGSAAYTFSLRPYELRSSPSGAVIVRVALTALDGQTLQAPAIDGVTASSVTRTANGLVALFAIAVAPPPIASSTGEISISGSEFEPTGLPPEAMLAVPISTVKFCKARARPVGEPMEPTLTTGLAVLQAV